MDQFRFVFDRRNPHSLVYDMEELIEIGIRPFVMSFMVSSILSCLSALNPPARFVDLITIGQCCFIFFWISLTIMWILPFGIVLPLMTMRSIYTAWLPQEQIVSRKAHSPYHNSPSCIKGLLYLSSLAIVPIISLALYSIYHGK